MKKLILFILCLLLLPLVFALPGQEIFDNLIVQGNVNATNITLNPDCSNGQILKWSNGFGVCGTDSTSAGGSPRQGDGIYLYNDTTTMFFNESKLNLSIVAGSINNSDVLLLLDNGTIIRNHNTSWITTNQNNLYNSSAEMIAATTGSVNSTSWLKSATSIFLSVLSNFVGIGTATPNMELVVVGSFNLTEVFFLNETNITADGSDVYINGVDVVVDTDLGVYALDSDVLNNHTQLQGWIDTNSSLRASQDGLLQANITLEEGYRITNDTLLKSYIDSNETGWKAADTTLTTNLANEQTWRISNDTLLKAYIDSNQTYTDLLISTLTSNLTLEEGYRITNDTLLKAYIDSNATYRDAEDVSIRASVNQNYTVLKGWIDSNNSGAVHIVGDETIDGLKTFLKKVTFIGGFESVNATDNVINSSMNLTDASGVTQVFLNGLGDSYILNSLGIGTATPSTILNVKDSSVNSAPAFTLENDARAFSLEVDGSDGDKFKIRTDVFTRDIVSIEDDSKANMLDLTSTAVTFNGANQDIDLIVKDDPGNTAFFVQGSDGNVGIGTATPGDTLEVNGNIKLGTNDVIYVPGQGVLKIGDNDDIDFNNGQVYLDQSTANLGIGTTAPEGLLNIGGAVPGGFWYGSNIAAPVLGIYQSEANTVLADNIPGLLLYNGDTTAGNFQQIVFASENSGGTRVGIATIAAQANTRTGNWGTGELIFSTSRDGAGNAESMRIDGTGNVGIGTSDPSELLEISAAVLPTIRIDNTDTSINTDQVVGSLDFHANDASGSGVGVAGSISSIGENAGTYYGLALSTKNGGSGLTEAMRINRLGNVGIKNTAPVEALDVTGNVIISGSLNTSSAYNKVGNSVSAIAHNQADDLIVGGTSHTGITIYTDNAVAGTNLWFADPDSQTIGRLQYHHTDNSMRFYTNSGERLRIDDAGNVGVGTTVPSAKLHVSDTTTTSLNVSDTLFVDGSNSRVGIDKTLPDDIFHISDGSDAFLISLSNTGQVNTIASETNAGGITINSGIMSIDGPANMYIDYNTRGLSGTRDLQIQHDGTAVLIIEGGDDIGNVIQPADNMKCYGASDCTEGRIYWNSTSSKLSIRG